MYHAELYPSSYTLLYCPLEQECDVDTPLVGGPYELLRHLHDVHGIVIHEPEQCLPFLDRYLDSVKQRLRAAKTGESEERSPDVQRHEPAPRREFGTQEDTLDRAIRVRLQTDRLKAILELKQAERATVYFDVRRRCLFCAYEDAFAKTFQHMFYEHRFNVGQLDNLVMVPRMLDLLEQKLSDGRCLFCSQQVDDASLAADGAGQGDVAAARREAVLQHMRSRQHFKIHPRDGMFDPFYISNYVHLPHHGCANRSNDDEDEDDDERKAFSEELEDDDEEDTSTHCLFCELICSNCDALFAHLRGAHNVDLSHSLLPLPFTDRMQLVNFLRFSQQHLQCPGCGDKSSEPGDYYAHIGTCFLGSGRSLAEAERWREPQFLFPAYGEHDDPLLFSLDLDDGDDE